MEDDEVAADDSGRDGETAPYASVDAAIARLFSTTSCCFCSLRFSSFNSISKSCSFMNPPSPVLDEAVFHNGCIPSSSPSVPLTAIILQSTPSLCDEAASSSATGSKARKMTLIGIPVLLVSRSPSPYSVPPAPYRSVLTSLLVLLRRLSFHNVEPLTILQCLVFLPTFHMLFLTVTQHRLLR